MTLFRIAALIMMAGVIPGAFGAHARSRKRFTPSRYFRIVG